ncbi:Hypothetical protein SMAX5B_013683 [Scophthalmus maximus]|uniref:Uncharacterized protein n=1 Tax=Scophthalmus maximus TaxID=52904 RepID=A0A2U9AZQ7_SCOMX|nr:Hypothetical protein SMAX5B_013683 [Scophthalmus maximus]
MRTVQSHSFLVTTEELRVQCWSVSTDRRSLNSADAHHGLCFRSSFHSAVQRGVGLTTLSSPGGSTMPIFTSE